MTKLRHFNTLLQRQIDCVNLWYCVTAEGEVLGHIWVRNGKYFAKPIYHGFKLGPFKTHEEAERAYAQATNSRRGEASLHPGQPQR